MWQENQAVMGEAILLHPWLEAEEHLESRVETWVWEGGWRCLYPFTEPFQWNSLHGIKKEGVGRRRGNIPAAPTSLRKEQATSIRKRRNSTQVFYFVFIWCSNKAPQAGWQPQKTVSDTSGYHECWIQVKVGFALSECGNGGSAPGVGKEGSAPGVGREEPIPGVEREGSAPGWGGEICF